MLTVAACINAETVIFGINYKEALSSLFLHAPTVILQFSVYIRKKLVARCCCMDRINGETAIVGTCYKEALCSSLLCINGETAIFGIFSTETPVSLLLYASMARKPFLSICYKEALYLPLLHTLTPRSQVFIYIMKKLCAHCWCMHQW